jgi:hypothetical protein
MNAEYLISGGYIMSKSTLMIPKGRNHWEDLSISGTITLRWALERQGTMG